MRKSKSNASPSRTLAIVGRITSCFGFGAGCLLSYHAMSLKQPWLAFGIMLMTIAYTNKFTGAEMAAIFHEVAVAFNKRKLGPSNPTLEIGDEDADS